MVSFVSWIIGIETKLWIIQLQQSLVAEMDVLCTVVTRHLDGGDMYKL